MNNVRNSSSGLPLSPPERFQKQDKNWEYEPGDTIGIMPQNDTTEVQQLLYHLDAENVSQKLCKICIKDHHKKKVPLPYVNHICTIWYIFKNYVDIRCIPKKLLIRTMLEHATCETEKQRLRELCSKEHSEAYTKYILEAGITFIELLLSFPSCKPPVTKILEHLPLLQPRPYSVASSPLISPHQIAFVFSVVKRHGFMVNKGLCSGQLKSLILQQDMPALNDNGRRTIPLQMKMYLRCNNGFRLPLNPELPLILVGPGTGVSPFIGFLSHRSKQKEIGNVIGGDITLFYGCRYKDKDFLFKEELNFFLNDGTLTTLYVSFSRDNKESKIKYVQDNILLHGTEIAEAIFLHEAIIYVCGDAKNMGMSVFKAFIHIIQTYKDFSYEDASRIVKELQTSGRYIQDIWT